MKNKRMHVWHIFLSLHVWQFSMSWKFANLVIFTPGIFLCFPTLTSFQSWWNFTVANKINFCGNMSMTNYLQKVTPARISPSDWFCVTALVSSNDEKASLKALTKMYPGTPIWNQKWWFCIPDLNSPSGRVQLWIGGLIRNILRNRFQFIVTTCTFW